MLRLGKWNYSAVKGSSVVGYALNFILFKSNKSAIEAVLGRVVEIL